MHNSQIHSFYTTFVDIIFGGQRLRHAVTNELALIIYTPRGGAIVYRPLWSLILFSVVMRTCIASIFAQQSVDQ